MSEKEKWVNRNFLKPAIRKYLEIFGLLFWKKLDEDHKISISNMIKSFIVLLLIYFALGDTIIYSGATGQLENGFQDWYF